MQDRADVLAYVRPLDDADDALDAPLQRTAIRACTRGERLGTPEIYEESASAGRLGFLHLVNDLAACEQRGIDRPPVVVATLRVLGESAIERARRLLVLESLGARVIFADGRTPEDALRREWERRPEAERRRDRARESMRAKALRGVVLGRPPYGYVVEDRQLVPHPRESQVVKRMFREYVEDGEGLRRIAARLNRDGLRSRRGLHWTPGAVRVVLKNPTYTGLYRRLGVVVPSSHPAIIDRATYGAAQRRMTARRTSRTTQERHEYTLAGLLRCGECGSPMIGERRRLRDGVSISYRCEDAVSRGTCHARGRRAEVIEAAVREELARSDTHYPVAVHDLAAPDPVARRQRLERRLTQALERWLAGEWRYHELVGRAAATVRRLHEFDLPREESPAEPEEARRVLLEEWDSLDAAERAQLLHRVVAEAVVSGDDVRLTRRR